MASPEPIAGRCAARVKPKPEQGRAGGYCELRPMTGQTRCRSHGGRAPQNMKAAERREALAEAEAAAVTFGLPVKVDPIDALLGELWRTQGAVQWLERQIRAIEPDALTWGLTEVAEVHASQFTGTNRTESARIHGLMALYQTERQHLTLVSEKCVKVGIAAKEQQRMEMLGGLLLDRMSVLAAAAGLDPASVAVAELISTVLTSGAPPPSWRAQPLKIKGAKRVVSS